MTIMSAISPRVIFVCRCIPDDSADRVPREAARGWGLAGLELPRIATAALKTRLGFFLVGKRRCHLERLSNWHP